MFNGITVIMFKFLQTINKNIVYLYMSMVISLILGIVGSILITNNMKPDEFGKLSFFRILVGFIQLISSFGLYHTISRLIALNNKNKFRKSLLWGYNFKISFIAGLLIVLLLVIYSFFNDYIFENNLGKAILYLSPIGIIIPFRNMLEISFEGDDNKKLLIFSRVLPKVFFLTLIILFITFSKINFSVVYILEMSSFLLVLIFLFKKIGVNLSANKITEKIIFSGWKDYGLKIYYSILLASISGYLLNFYIPYFINVKILGFFLLASALSYPLTMLPIVVSSVYFEKFAVERKIEVKTIKLTVLFSLLALVVYNVLISIFFPILYSVEYMPVLPIIYFLSIQCTLHGIGDFFNKFLCSCGAGNEALKGSYFVGAINLSSIIFIYYFGLEGAILSKIISSLGYMILMIIFYVKFVRREDLMT